MGNSAAGGYDDDEHELDKFDGIETLGYRVLGVQPNSPASQAGLVSFFDFLVGADGQMLMGSGEDLQEGDEYDDVDFPAMLQEFKGKPLELLVWNIKSQTKRLVNIIPQDGWGGAGLLGVTIRLDNYGGADERLIRVLEMEPNSPAAVAGLVPLQDYLLGTTTESFEDTNVLADVLHAHVDRVVELYVYNTTSDVVRIVALMPTWSWGGKGLLGAEVGTGYLHRLPRECRATGGTSVERKVRWTRHGGRGGTSSGAAKADASSTTNGPSGEGGGEKQQQMQQQSQEATTPPTSTSSNPASTGTSNAPTPTIQNTRPSLSARPDELHMEPQLEMEPEPHQEGTVQTATVDEISKPIEPVVPPSIHSSKQQQQQPEITSSTNYNGSAVPLVTEPQPTTIQQHEQPPQPLPVPANASNNGSNRPSVATAYAAPTASTTAASLFAGSPPATAEALFSSPPPVVPTEATTSAVPPASASSTSSYNSGVGAAAAAPTHTYYGGYSNTTTSYGGAAATSYGAGVATTVASSNNGNKTAGAQSSATPITPFMPPPPISHLSR